MYFVVATGLLLVLRTSLGIQDLPPTSPSSNSTLQKTQLDIFLDLLAHKYASTDRHLTPPEFSVLWTNLLQAYNHTLHKDDSLSTFCRNTFNHSPICELINKVNIIFHSYFGYVKAKIDI